MPNTNYDTDFYAWANEQAALLRSGALSSADIENIAGEIESMGNSEKRELGNRLIVILLHLLKWQFQPKSRSSSWETSIIVQRNAVVRIVRDNPSLKPKIPEVLADVYDDAFVEAVEETKLPKSAFPATCPYTFEQIVDPGFWPE